MRSLFVAGLVFLLASCGQSTVSTTKTLQPDEGGFAYTLPKGLVPIVVFVDEKGVGITIEPAVTAVDSKTGTLIGRFNPSSLNKEDIQVKLDPETGFLSTLTNTSTSQALAVAEEAAKSLGRLTFQNARAEALKERVVVMEDSFDPLSSSDVARMNRGIRHAVRHAVRAHEGLNQTPDETVTLRVTMPDGSNPFAGGSKLRPASVVVMPSPANCQIGICARTMTSRVIRIELDGTAFGGKLVNVPSKEVIPLPVTGAVFADRKTSVTVQNGILSGTSLVQESEALGLVKIPGQIIGGFIAGLTQAATDQTNLAKKEKEAIDAQNELVKSQQERLTLQNETIQARSNAYLTESLTIYPFSNSLATAVQNQNELAEVKRQKQLEDAANDQLQLQPNEAEGGALLEQNNDAADPEATPNEENIAPAGGGTE